MAVAPAGAIYKSLTFDGKTSREYGVYITGQAVFNAPERDVEMIEIPGRNGAFALDHGRFQNIEVTYPAGIFAENNADFAEAISDFRNWLCSRQGYVKLTDDYNPNEYRMAIYKSGLEVNAEQLEAGEFDIVFECKPQRFLTSGENTISVTSGDTITNPTLFDARPLLEITGYGNIDIGSDEIEIHNEPVGNIIIYNKTTWNSSSTRSITIETQYANVNDEITVNAGPTFSASYMVSWTLAAGTITNASSTVSGNGSANAGDVPGTKQMFPIIRLGDGSFAYGTSATYTATASLSITTSNYGTLTGSIGVTLAYDGDSTFTLSKTVTKPSQFSASSPQLTIGDITLASSQTLLGNPLYVDLDIGEAYKIENDVPVSVNNGVVMPAELPTLTPGTNTITFDNTITQLDIIPRWFKI